jgi:hypothetical protein
MLGGLRFQQDRQRLVVGGFGQHLDFGRRAAADWMLDHDKRIVRQAEHARNVFGRHLERFGAKHHGAFAELFKADAIMQTAR